jgi:selenocysteine lyase/cysteine desulfurase
MEKTLNNLKELQLLSNVKVIVFDHMVSIPAIKLPIKKLTKLVRSYYQNRDSISSSMTRTSNGYDQPFILVDGAHAWGQIPTNEISELLQRRINDNDDYAGYDGNSDYWIDAYVTNGHKWMYSPKGSAILWIHPSRITDVFPEPTVISSENFLRDPNGNIEMDDDPMYHRYIYTSTKDYTSMLSIHEAIKFRQHVLGGEDNIYTYIRNLALQAKQYLMTLWNIKVSLAPDTMEEYMINIILPIDRDSDNKHSVATDLQRWLYTQNNMYAIIAEEPSSGYIYTRLSSQIYLQFSDFQRLGAAVLEFLNGEDKQQTPNTTTAMKVLLKED